jgi:hypothetical protein
VNEEVRPRTGQITRPDGTMVPLLFEETDKPGTFRPLDLDGQPVIFREGDLLSADAIAPGQGIAIEFDTQPD